MIYQKFTLPAAVMAVTTMGASAAVVDLSSLDGTIATSQSVPELTISTTAPGVGVNIAALTVNGVTEYTICAASAGPTCANDFSIDFTTASTGVKITAADLEPATPTTAFDLTEISAFDALNVLLGTVTVTSADLFATTADSSGIFSLELDFSGFGAISSLVFDDQATDPVGHWRFALLRDRSDGSSAYSTSLLAAAVGCGRWSVRHGAPTTAQKRLNGPPLQDMYG